MTIQQLEKENERLRAELAKKPAATQPTAPAQPEAPKTKAEQYAALVAECRTKEAADFLAEHANELRAEMATACPERDNAMTAREQFAFITDPVQRSMFYEKHKVEILG